MNELQTVYQDGEHPPYSVSSQYYRHDIYCKNCGFRNKLEIRKGVTIASIIATCSKCGCVANGEELRVL